MSVSTEEILDDVVDEMSALWATKDMFVEQCRNIFTNYERDVKNFSSDFLPVLNSNSIKESTHHTISILENWHKRRKNVPSMASICQFSINYFNIKSDTYQQAIINAGFIADTPATTAYHNNLHFKKVLIQTIRLIDMHNKIHENRLQLNEREITLLLVAACIHDLGHDGHSNMAQGIPYPGRLEQRSFDIATKIFHAIDFVAPEDWQALNIMLLCTDVSSSAMRASYCDQMKLAYKHHFSGKELVQELSSEIRVLKDNKRLTLLSCLLHEADISTSAGLAYNISQFESRLLAMETGIDEIATPRGLQNFFKHLCHRELLTEAANELYYENMVEIQFMAAQDVEEGNIPFPSIEDFACIKLKPNS